MQCLKPRKTFETKGFGLRFPSNAGALFEGESGVDEKICEYSSFQLRDRSLDVLGSRAHAVEPKQTLQPRRQTFGRVRKQR